MSEHTHDELQMHHHHPRRKTDTTATDSPAAAKLGNSAMTSMLGGALDRAATKQQGAGPLDDEIASDIKSAKGGGQAMDDSTKADMESNLGVDLSGVRVHTGSQADHLSRSVQAEAFTTGSDIFFRSGRYEPSSSDGRRLLAHELTHVVQQSNGTGGKTGEVSHPNDPHEREASAVGDAVAASNPVAASPTSEAPSIAREAAPEEEDEAADRQAGEPDEEAADREAAAPEDEQEEASAD